MSSVRLSFWLPVICTLFQTLVMFNVSIHQETHLLFLQKHPAQHSSVNADLCLNSRHSRYLSQTEQQIAAGPMSPTCAKQLLILLNFTSWFGGCQPDISTV